MTILDVCLTLFTPMKSAAWNKFLYEMKRAAEVLEAGTKGGGVWKESEGGACWSCFKGGSFGEKKKELLVLFRGVFLEKRRWLLNA